MSIKKIIGIAMICLMFSSVNAGLFDFWESPNTEIEVNSDTSLNPNHKSFIGSDQVLNNLDTLTFSSTKTIGLYLYTPSYSAGIYYYPGNDYSTVTGNKCGKGDMVRFSYCDNKNSKSSCKTDIFSNVWQVKSSNDYLNFKDYFTGDSKGFYYSYTCYESKTSWEDGEKKYLYNDKCVDYETSNGKGVNHDTEKKCLYELEKKLEQEKEETCSYRLYDDKSCIGDRVYQKERQTDCSKGYTKYKQLCEYGCNDGACKSQPVTTCDEKEYDSYKCEGDSIFQKVRKSNCDKEYDKFIETCDLGCNDGKCLNEENPKEEKEEEKLNITTVENIEYEMYCKSGNVYKKAYLISNNEVIADSIKYDCIYGCLDGECTDENGKLKGTSEEDEEDNNQDFEEPSFFEKIWSWIVGWFK